MISPDCLTLSHFQSEQQTVGSDTIRFRSLRGLDYCDRPKDAIQKMNLFVPEDFFLGKSINGYTMDTAPVFMPNTVGGFMPGPAGEPGPDRFGRPNAAFEAIKHGYVVACPGIRGRTTGKKSQEFFVGGSTNIPAAEDGELCGKAPTFVVDMKAAIRFLRHYKEVLPGNIERIFTDGTSAGGALSALTGATGNHPDYEPYLQEIGAASERDDIFGAVCFCPITNLDHADMAYEWEFKGLHTAHYARFSVDETGQVQITPLTLQMDADRIALSETLASAFPDYVNQLDLKDENGQTLTLVPDGSGSFRDYICRQLIASAQREVIPDNLAAEASGAAFQTTVERAGYGNGSLTPVRNLPWLTFDGDIVTGIDWDAYVQAITRMKAAPAFDAPDLNSPENDEFGTADEPAKHFTAFGTAHSTVGGSMADPVIIRMMNPMNYIDDPEADTAPHWWIRHGSHDRDTSQAIAAILSLKLAGAGKNVDFLYPWGMPHAGDYDLDQLFDWIDNCCI